MALRWPIVATSPDDDAAADPDSRVYDVARETPLERGRRGCRGGCGNEVLLKREDLQPVFSFKLRGAYNRIAHLTDAEARARRHRGERRQSRAGRRVLGAASRPPRADRHAADDAGDQGRGGAGPRARRSCSSGDSYADAQDRAATSSSRRPGMTFVHPFDDPLRHRRSGHGRARDPAAPARRRRRRSSCRSAAAG